MKSALEQILAEQRRRQDAREDASVNRMTTFYAGVIDTLDGEIRAVTAMIERARADGTDVNPDWLRRQARYQLLQGQAQELYTLYADEGDRTIRDARIAEVRAGSVDAIEREGIYGPLPENADASINQQAVERMVHQLSAESPVRDSIRRWGLGDLQAIDQHLVDGVANGYGADKIVRNIRRDLTGDVPAWRVRTLVRTESMRAYRRSLNEQYLKNPDLQELEWVAFRGPRTCLACLAMDQTRHDIHNPPDTFHVQCRCSLVPVPYDPYGDYDYLQDEDPAEQWLRQNATRAQFPSQEAYDAFMRGDLGLQDFLGYHDDPVWGTSITQLSGKQAMANAGIVPGGSGPTSGIPTGGFSSVDDAKSWFEANGVEIEGGSPTLESMDGLARGYQRELAGDGSVPGKLEFVNLGPDGNYLEYAWYSDDPGEGWVRVNLDSPYWTDQEKTRKWIRESGWTVDDSPEAMVSHEIGHWKHFNGIEKESRGNAFYVGDTRYTGNMTKAHRGTAAKVSQYATTNQYEFIAETYAGIRSGKTYDDDVMNLYRQWGGPDTP